MNNIEVEIKNTDLQESQSQSDSDNVNIISLSKKTFELEDQYRKDKYKAKLESKKDPDPNLPQIFKYDIEELLPFYYSVLDIDKEPNETEKMLKDKNILIIYAQKYLFANDSDFETSIKFYTWILDEYKDSPDNKIIHKQRIQLLFKYEMFDECVYDLKKFINKYGNEDWAIEMMNCIGL
jgi:hypothetical protein